MVNENKLVSTYNQILRSLLDGKHSVNQLYNKTGLSKNNETTQTKKHLEKAQLIIEKDNKKYKDKKFHSQSHIIELSDFGYSVAFFLKNLDDFERSFRIFSDKIENKIGKPLTGISKFSREEIIRSLKREGWNFENISSFYGLITNLLEFKIFILRSVLEAVSFRYGYFITKFNPNKIAIDLIKKIIANKIMQYNLLKMDIIANMPYMKPKSNDLISKDENEINNYKIDKIYETFAIYFKEPIDFAEEEGFLFKEHISKEIKDLIIHLKSLTELNREHMAIFIELVSSKFEEIDSESEDKNILYLKEYYRKELALYNELFPES